MSNDTSYAPYGEAYNNTTNADFNFTGMMQDTGGLGGGLYDFPYREYSTVGRWISPDPAGLNAVDPTNPQSWNRYAYVLNNPLSATDPTGLECVWDDGSFDSENDQKTGSVGSCQNAGGTWVELGQLGGWSGQANAANAQLVNSIQNGLVGSVNMIGLDGQNYSSFYNGAGQTTETITPNGTTVYVGAMLGENFQNNLGALAHSPWLLSWILPLWPLPELGIGPAGSIAWNPATKTLCGSIGAGGSVGDNLSVGPVAGRTLNGQQASSSQINQIFSGWSGSFGFNVPTGPAPVGPGVQVSANGSGAVYGPTVGVAGASVSSTYSVCASF
ncbi:MAG: RHS repeat-associated core domain-containing protein [Candidatus Sulfotelmatobacter sp.]